MTHRKIPDQRRPPSRRFIVGSIVWLTAAAGLAVWIVWIVGAIHP